MTRRDLLVTAGLSGLGLMLGLSSCSTRERIVSPSGTVSLPIPPLAPAQVADGRRRFTLTASTGHSQLITGHPEIRTPTMGYNGAILGPTLRAARGEDIAVDVRNNLDEPTTLHWHGMHLPPAMDGGPHKPIPAGGTRTVEWRLEQPAATLWYHPHPHGQTERQVLNGLAGMFIVDDAVETGLPDEYGTDDIPLVLQDRFLDSDGRIVRTDDDHALGTIGRTLLSNGVSGTHLTVTTELVRLRLLNGCTGRFLDLRLDGGRPLTLIGTDGGLLTTPAELDHLLLSPAERAEILVRLAPGERVMLRTERPEIPGTIADAGLTDMTAGDFVELRAQPHLRPARHWQLPTDQRPALSVSDATHVRTFELRMPFLNGKLMDMERIDAIVRLGDTEVWEVTTSNPFPHNFHIHGVQFRIIDIDGNPPPAYANGWKDTVPVLPHQRTRLIMRFADYADTRTPYMMHCHLVQHEDIGMMGQFLVTSDGTGPDRITTSDHSGH